MLETGLVPHTVTPTRQTAIDGGEVSKSNNGFPGKATVKTIAALSGNSWRAAFYAAFLKTTNSVRVAAMR
jgi:hypothetical protein